MPKKGKKGKKELGGEHLKKSDRKTTVAATMGSRKPNMGSKGGGTGVMKKVFEELNEELCNYAPLEPFNEAKADLGRALGII